MNKVSIPKGIKPMQYILETNRLGFRNWKEEDRIPFYEMNSNPEVMKYFSKILNVNESNELYDKIVNKLELNPYGFWAVEKKEDSQFIGFIGLSDVSFVSSFTPCVEIGCRILPFYWGRGFATEGATACLQYSFEILNLEKVFSFTSLQNQKSESVMKKIGMHKLGEFDHPNLPLESPLSRHVLYTIDTNEYKKQNKIQL
jgi:RimJ/RimL family protein N-acetyltransferase